MDNMKVVFVGVALRLFEGAPVFGDLASAGETTKQVLEKAQVMFSESKDVCEGAIGWEDEYETFENAENSAKYLLALIEEGVFPNADTPYDSDWGRTFDSIAGSCLNIAFGFELLRNMKGEDEIVLSTEEVGAAEKAAAEKAEAECKAEEAANAEADRKVAAQEAKAEHKTEVARQAKAAAIAATDEAAKKAAAEKLAAEKADAKKAATEKGGFFSKAKNNVKKAKKFFMEEPNEGKDNEPEPKSKKKPRRNKQQKESTEVLQDFTEV